MMTVLEKLAVVLLIKLRLIFTDLKEFEEEKATQNTKMCYFPLISVGSVETFVRWARLSSQK